MRVEKRLKYFRESGIIEKSCRKFGIRIYFDKGGRKWMQKIEESVKYLNGMNGMR